MLISGHTDTADYQREEIAPAIEVSRGEGNRHRVVRIFLETIPRAAVPYGLRRKQRLFLGSGGMEAVAASLMDLLDRSKGEPESTEMRRVRRICARLSYEKPAKSRVGLRELNDAATEGIGPVRQVIAAGLREFMLDLDELRWDVIPNPVRALRNSVNVMRAAAQATSASIFSAVNLRESICTR